MGLFTKEQPNETVENSDLPLDSNATTELVESDETLYRQEDETQQEYNERIPVAVQPVQPGATLSYLGEPL